MKKIILFIALFFCALPLFSAWVDADGTAQESINVSRNIAASYVPSIALDSSGYPHIAWFDEGSGNSEIYYLRWNGGAWVDINGSAGREAINVSNNYTTSKYPVLQLDSLDRPRIVWEDGVPGNREIYYLRWNGSAWVDADGTGQESINISNSTARSGHPSFRLESSGVAHVAWHEGEEEEAPLAEIWYQKYMGGQWVNAQGSAAGSRTVYSGSYASLWVSLGLDASGAPHIAWCDGPEDNREIYYAFWDGSGWQDKGGTLNVSQSPDYSAWPKIDIDSAGNPHLVWEDASEWGYQEVFYLKWDGSSWVDAEGSASRAAVNVSRGYHYSSVPSVRVDASGAPHIVWSQGAIETCDIHCVKWNGSSWTDESGSGTAYKKLISDIDNSEWACFALDDDGYPHVVWANGLIYLAHDIFYLEWQPEGTPTATPTINLSATITPTCTVTPTGTITCTQTRTSTISPTRTMPVLTPDPCWADADGSGQESKFVAQGEEVEVFIDANNIVHMVYQHENQIYYLRHDGTQWTDADGFGTESALISGPVNNCFSPRLEAGPSGMPRVAWIGGSPGFLQVYYLGWNGSEWVDADGSFQDNISIPVVEGGYASGLDLSLDAAGMPQVAWCDYPEGKTDTVKDIFYLKWNGFEWADTDGAGHESAMVTDNTRESSAPRLKTDSSGAVHLAWQEETAPPYDTIFYAYNGSGTWENYGDIVTNPYYFNSRQPSLELDASGMPCVAFNGQMATESDVCFLRLNGSEWVDADGLGQESINMALAGDAVYPSLEIDSSGSPCVSWYEPGGICYAQYDGSEWVDADGLGMESVLISGKSGGYYTTSVTLDAAGNPAVAWQDREGVVPVINFLKYICGNDTPTITPTHTVSPTLTLTPTITMTGTITLTHTITPTFTDTPTVTVSPTPYPDGFFAVCPNPVNLNLHGCVRFLNVEPGSSIYIFTLSGEYVNYAEAQGVFAEWGLKNRYNTVISPGIYYYIYRKPDAETPSRRGKLFVIRK